MMRIDYMRVQKGRLLLYPHLNVEQIAPPPGIGRDVRQQGHWGTEDMELLLTKVADLVLVKPLILLSSVVPLESAENVDWARV